MTRDIQIPPAELIERFENACRDRKLKITQQRLEVFRELARYPGHPTADDIYGRVRRRLKTISLDTVYRTIGTFEKHVLISGFSLSTTKPASISTWINTIIWSAPGAGKSRIFTGPISTA